MENYIITISRRFASKGHEIAGLMSESLGIPVYDRSAVEARVQSLQMEAASFEREPDTGRGRTSGRTGFTSRESNPVGSRQDEIRYKHASSEEEKAQESAKERSRTDTGTRSLLMGLFRREIREEIRDEAQLEFERQSEVIRSLVREGPCIILGRCADQIFEDYPRALHIFIYADDQDRIRNTMQMLHTGEEEARSLVQNEDRARENYRRRFSSHPEDEVFGRHILIDSGKLGARKSAEILVQAAKYLFWE